MTENQQHTPASIAKMIGVQTASIQRRIERKGFDRPKSNQILSNEQLLIFKFELLNDLTTNATESLKVLSESKKTSSKPQRVNPKDSRLKIIQILPLPMLALPASYGVYFFASQFVPDIVAIIEALAFELIYIGLASMKGLSEQQTARARKVSLAAVLVSVVYNTLAGAIHMRPAIISDVNIFIFWILCIIHGVPLATLAFYMADLIFHNKK